MDPIINGDRAVAWLVYSNHQVRNPFLAYLVLLLLLLPPAGKKTLVFFNDIYVVLDSSSSSSPAVEEIESSLFFSPFFPSLHHGARLYLGIWRLSIFVFSLSLFMTIIGMG